MAMRLSACRAPLRRALAQSAVARPAAFRPAMAAVPRRRIVSAPFSTSSTCRQAAAAAAAAEAKDDAAAKDKEAGLATPISSCPEGTVLTGLNYTRGRTDPVALRDDEYPLWLWSCLDVMKKADAAEDADAGDEFSKSKKQRRMALRRQRELEAQVLATGDVAALAPKIPLQHQSVNLLGAADDLASTLQAAAQRKELRVAMRKERRAKIKESNYLRSM